MAKKNPVQPVDTEETEESQEVFLKDLTPSNEPRPRRGRPGGVKGQRNLQWTEARSQALLENYHLFGLNYEDIAESLQGNALFEGYTDSLTPDKVKAALKKTFALLKAQGVDVPEIPRKVATRKDIAPSLATFFQSLQASQ
jgi:hypothetical protein